MSDFKLDVDSPYPKPSKELLSERPEPLNYPQNHPKYRFYGNNIKKMIDIANGWEEGDLKQALKYTIANHMKKSYLNWNKDTVEDAVIFKHLLELSDGKIDLADLDENLTDSSIFLKAKNKGNNHGRQNSGKKNYRNNRNKKRF